MKASFRAPVFWKEGLPGDFCSLCLGTTQFYNLEQRGPDEHGGVQMKLGIDDDWKGNSWDNDDDDDWEDDRDGSDW